ncbi:RNA polymerase sigma factor SigJ [Hyphomonas sp.]|jgi:RNA polymerase sigma-70 factor (ECF subfamily)|uniref:RNA polymerase sigma factor SigJ n=1 Tax=Hyphomonas sp. TaxID=87 RepID=UPI000C3AFC48|nr:RNA polymerase sigma factor SigJ [Hyphomonas sp.]MAU67882.1 RNA polymerase subunit sigma [Hyphomonas sp.]MBM57786.1 RNA polymerase subunit sigma [Hyphomonas sp.]
MTADTALFEAERPALTALCYRMLGERAGAEDAVQDTWLRWERADHAAIENPSAWLRRTATRIAIDALRSARVRRETYPGPWLPEPLVESDSLGVEERFALAQECELALLWAMERLSPTERAAFILREAFDAGYDEIAGITGKSEAACRQLVSRAHKRLQESGPRFDASPEDVADLLERFMAAAGALDHDAALNLFAPDAVAYTDGGKKVRAALRPLIGPQDITQVLMAVMSKAMQEKAQWSVEPGLANGGPAIVRWLDGRVDLILTLAPSADGRIAWLYAMRNPDKLPG